MNLLEEERPSVFEEGRVILVASLSEVVAVGLFPLVLRKYKINKFCLFFLR